MRIELDISTVAARSLMKQLQEKLKEATQGIYRFRIVSTSVRDCRSGGTRVVLKLLVVSEPVEPEERLDILELGGTAPFSLHWRADTEKMWKNFMDAIHLPMALLEPCMWSAPPDPVVLQRYTVGREFLAYVRLQTAGIARFGEEPISFTIIDPIPAGPNAGPYR